MTELQVCRYLTTREPLPPWPATGYDYILAGNGLWKRARNRHCSACLRLSRANVAGLPDLAASLDLTGPRLPARLLHVALQDARRRAWVRPVEAVYHLYRTGAGRARLVYPPQSAGMASASYRGGADPDIILDIHSHVEMTAFFSGTDNRDEQGFRFYAVMGHIFTRPQIRLRLGIYGDHWPVPLAALFDGPGPFGAAPCYDDDEGDSAWTYDHAAAIE